MVMMVMLVFMVVVTAMVVLMMMFMFVLMVMVMMMFMFMVVVVMMSAANGACLFFAELFKLRFKRYVFLFHGFKQLCAAELVPLSGDDNGICIVFSYHLNRFCGFLFTDKTRVAEDYSLSVLYLVVKKFAKVFHIHFAFACVNNGCEAVELKVFIARTLNGTDNVAELAYA